MRKLTTSLFLLCCALLLNAQEDSPPYHAYFFEGDEVVFEFDLRYFEEATQDGNSKRVDFDDFQIYKVAVAGDFNDWSREDWRMEQVSPGRYQLRKPIEAFNDAFRWEFKFIINGKYWAEPSARVRNRAAVTQHNWFWETAYNHELYTARPHPEGNARFFLPGYTEADEVLLTGSFSNWDEKGFTMQRTEGGWELQLELDPGRYEYKFIVDGEWMHDPANPNTVVNQYHTLNSVYEITKEVQFRLAGFAEAENVRLAGSFTDWAENARRMHREGNAWVVSLPLTGGKHLYKFIVDGEWMTDPANPLKEYDWHGHLNSVIMVR